MGTVDAGLSGRRPTGTTPGAGDEPLSGSVRHGPKSTWTAAWQALNSPVGVVLAVVVAFGSVLGILMSVFLGELRAMEQRLRQDMAAMEQELRQDMAAMEQRLRQDMAAMEERLRQDMAAMDERLQGQISELRVAQFQGALEGEADGEPPGPGPSQGAAPKADAGTPEGNEGGTS